MSRFTRLFRAMVVAVAMAVCLAGCSTDRQSSQGHRTDDPPVTVQPPDTAGATRTVDLEQYERNSWPMPPASLPKLDEVGCLRQDEFVYTIPRYYRPQWGLIVVGFRPETAISDADTVLDLAFDPDALGASSVHMRDGFFESDRGQHDALARAPLVRPIDALSLTVSVDESAEEQYDRARWPMPPTSLPRLDGVTYLRRDEYRYVIPDDAALRIFDVEDRARAVFGFVIRSAEQFGDNGPFPDGIIGTIILPDDWDARMKALDN